MNVAASITMTMILGDRFLSPSKFIINDFLEEKREVNWEEERRNFVMRRNFCLETSSSVQTVQNTLKGLMIIMKKELARADTPRVLLLTSCCCCCCYCYSLVLTYSILHAFLVISILFTLQHWFTTICFKRNQQKEQEDAWSLKKVSFRVLLPPLLLPDSKWWIIFLNSFFRNVAESPFTWRTGRSEEKEIGKKERGDL